MSDAPETIWIDGAVTDNRWHEHETDCTLSGVAAVEYSRSDLTLTTAQIMAHPKVQALVEALAVATRALDDEPEYHEQGMGCGLEDRNIADRYEAMRFGWDQAIDRVCEEQMQIKEAINEALAALEPKP